MSASNVVMCDGYQRYADKPFIRQRPRAISYDLLMFYVEERRLAERDALALWDRT